MAPVLPPPITSPAEEDVYFEDESPPQTMPDETSLARVRAAHNRLQHALFSNPYGTPPRQGPVPALASNDRRTSDSVASGVGTKRDRQTALTQSEDDSASSTPATASPGSGAVTAHDVAMAAVTGSNKPARRRGKRNKKGGRPAAGNQRDTNISATTMTNSNATHIQPFQRYNAGHAAAIAAIRCPGETISHNTHYGAVPFRQNNVPAQRSTEAQRPTQGGSGLSNTHESMSDSNCGDATSSASGGRSCDVGNDNEVEMEWT